MVAGLVITTKSGGASLCTVETAVGVADGAGAAAVAVAVIVGAVIGDGVAVLSGLAVGDGATGQGVSIAVGLGDIGASRGTILIIGWISQAVCRHGL